ncbi:MAG: type II toxin-antitoxin system VapC family toxin [Sphingobium sp.]|jgi:toxin FitB|nr:type II toxin-antitoxin system VapC family toxin [Sphingobium sp.]MCI1271812.1 type II toxin-antitoxin system VapC family toxin [Sphingobium sp.]MCI2054175.1 type II toxin-antitoxin system VapC family toxin [Sphingobium sp.]
MIVVDTNVWSELTKAAPDPAVIAWEQAHAEDLWLSSVVLAELRAGVALLPSGKRQTQLENNFRALTTLYADRLLDFDEPASHHYAQVLARAKASGRPIATADAMIAATALHHGMAVATRDMSDFAGAGVRLINPWEG